MKIVVSEIPDEGLDIDAKETLKDEESGKATRASLKLRVTKTDKNVLVSGEVRAELQLLCSRCLKDFEREVVLPVELAYCPAEEYEGEESHELAPDELSTAFYSGDEIDLAEMAREQLLLNVPMKTLCSEECKGICPKCGADLNEQTCGCEVRTVDPRLQVLEKLLKKGKE